jgi:hypothetical protein
VDSRGGTSLRCALAGRARHIKLLEKWIAGASLMVTPPGHGG